MSDVQVPRRAGSDRGKEAGEFPPGPILRTIQELEDTGLRVDWAQRVASARLVFANHESLQHDFPSLTDTALLRRDPALAGMSGSTRAMALRQVRESWLLAYAGLVSVAQTQSSCANTAIAVDGNVRQVWRPSRYGRALVTSASQPQDDGSHDPPCGLLDVKGAGVATGCTASLERHSSGLCSLGEVLREVLFQSLINEIFRRAATGFGTVPIYGVIDLGFDARTRSGQTLAAGLLVRRAHRRPPGGMDLPACGSIEEQTKLEIELLLRHYGLTSSNRGSRFRFESGTADLRIFYGGEAVTEPTHEHREVILGWLRGANLPLECDGVNIQLTREVSLQGRSRAQLVDFGQFEMRPRFDDPLVSLARNRLLRWSASIWPDDPGFVQPLPALCVSEALWGFGTWQANARHRPRRTESEGPSMFVHRLARSFRAGRLTGAQVHAELDRFIAHSAAKW